MPWRNGSVLPPHGSSPAPSAPPGKAPKMEKQKAQADALRRHKPKASDTGEFPAVGVAEK